MHQHRRQSRNPWFEASALHLVESAGHSLLWTTQIKRNHHVRSLSITIDVEHWRKNGHSTSKDTTKWFYNMTMLRPPVSSISTSRSRYRPFHGNCDGMWGGGTDVDRFGLFGDQFSYARDSDEFYLEVSDTARYPEALYAIVLTVCITISRLVRIYQSLFHHIRPFCECVLCWSSKNRYYRTGTSQQRSATCCTIGENVLGNA